MCKKLSIITIAALIVSPAFAGVTATKTGSNVWDPGAIIETAPLMNPTPTTNSGPWAYSPEGSWGVTEDGLNIAAESFVTGGEFTLRKLSVFLIGNGTEADITIRLFQVTDGGGFNAGSPYNDFGGGSTAFDRDIDDEGGIDNLFSDGLSFHFDGDSAGAVVWNLDLTGSDQVAMNADSTYVFEMVTNNLPTNTIMWIRSAYMPQPNLNTHMYRANSNGGHEMARIRGDVQRNAALALYVPEPATMVMLGLGGLALLRRRK